MTYGDIFLQVLIETVPEKKDEFQKRFEFMKAMPSVGKFNTEVPEQEEARLLTALRKDKAGVLKMLLEGDLSRFPFDA